MDMILERTAIELWEALEAKVIKLPGCTCIFSGLPNPFFNRVIISDSITKDEFLHAIAIARSEKLPYSLFVPNFLKSSHSYIKKHFFLHSKMTSMLLDLADFCCCLQESPVIIQEVKAVDDVRKTFEIWQESFAVDLVTYAQHVKNVLSLFEKGGLPFHFYLGYIGKEPVSCGWLLLGQEYASIYNIGTRHVARKKGAATHMMHRLLTDAKLGMKKSCL
jgi:hypothetical protein